MTAKGFVKKNIFQSKNKTKTNKIQFESLEMSEYLKRNQNNKLSKYIFKIRSGTLDLKDWCQWRYEDNLCVGCGTKAETMTHFMACNVYSVGNSSEKLLDWRDIYENNMDKQIEVAKEVERRFSRRETLLEEAGLDSPPGTQLRS